MAHWLCLSRRADIGRAGAPVQRHLAGSLNEREGCLETSEESIALCSCVSHLWCLLRCATKHRIRPTYPYLFNEPNLCVYFWIPPKKKPSCQTDPSKIIKNCAGVKYEIFICSIVFCNILKNCTKVWENNFVTWFNIVRLRQRQLPI